MLSSVCSRAILFTLLLSTLFSIAIAVPMVLSHQGRLLDATDHPLSGTYTIIYSIHDAPVGGTQLWIEDHAGVVVTDGLFSVVLGGSVPLSADVLAGSGGGGGGAIRYLQVQIAGQPAIMPRTQLVSSPYSVATSRISGDVQTAPGELKASAASDTKRIGIRVADSLSEASSIAIDEPGVQIALRITPDSTVFDQGETSGDRVMVHAVHRGEDRISQTITPTTSSVAIKTKGTGAEANKSASITATATPGGNANVMSAVDLDGDDDPEGEISQSVTPTTSGVAIKTKGTGADANKTAACSAISSIPFAGALARFECTIDDDGDGDPEMSVTSGCDSSGASQVMEKKGLNAVNVKLARSISGSSGSLAAVDALDMDSDDDGVMDRSVTSSCDATGAKHAINTKGTGATNHRSITSMTNTEAATILLEADLDGDGNSEGEISQSVTPTTCGVAIKTKGTGAEKNRTIGGSCDDSSAVQYLDIDDDGDGHAEARGIISVKSSSGSGSLSATVSSQMTCDSDDDGIPDNEISQSVTPTTCGVAIKTKGTGADPNRVLSIQNGATPDALSSMSSIDDDGDTVPESEISQSVTPTTCGVAIKTKGTGADKNRTVGSSCSPSGALHYLDIDDDGDGTPESSLREAATPSVSEISISKHQDVSSVDLRMAATDDSAVVVLGYDGLASESLKLQVVASGSANPIEHSSGAHLTAGGVWTNASDANLKENFRSVDGAELLEKIEELPVSRWNYKAESDEVTHIGPTAQDFQKAFGVGENAKTISTIDPSGIALAAIKELSKQNRELKEQNAKLMKQLEDLVKKVDKLSSGN